jgi:hypothetical protein
MLVSDFLDLPLIVGVYPLDKHACQRSMHAYFS